MLQSVSSLKPSHRTLDKMAIAGAFAMVFATSASAAPLLPNSAVAAGRDQNFQTVHLICDNYGRCYRSSRRYVRGPYPSAYSSYGYYPGYYGYGPGISFGFGGHHFNGGHHFGEHGFEGHGFGGHGGGHHE